ncbi:MAG: recombinase family protein, partial [Clostridiales bacterium]|nr:recombinase family protein [Clostridiales bacterium]
GVPPFGYDVVEQAYVINELEAEYVRRIFSAAANKQGFTAVLHEMEERGIRGKRGKTIRYTQIYEMLRNIKYTGTYVYCVDEEPNREDRRQKPSAIRLENALPAIIDIAQFEEVQRIMTERKQVGRKAGYLCSRLVYCECGVKMHGRITVRSGHEYYYYRCPARCGVSAVRMEEVDAAAREYLNVLLSPENQQIIAAALRQYQSGETNRANDFKTLIKKKMGEKQKEYDSLMGNLKGSVLPPAVVQDMANQMLAIQREIEALRDTPPPKDYTVEQITTWLEALRMASDEKAIHLLIERIDIKKETGFSIESTLKSVVREIGSGGPT